MYKGMTEWGAVAVVEHSSSRVIKESEDHL